MATRAKYIIELEKSLRERADTEEHEVRTGVGLLIADPTDLRALQVAVRQLNLEPVLLNDKTDVEALLQLEMIVANRQDAAHLREVLGDRERDGEGVNPAIVAVVQNEYNDLSTQVLPSDHGFDGILPMPQLPSALAVQMSLILYANRTFARRFATAMHELRLNRRIFRSVTSGVTVANATLPDLPLVYVNPAFEIMSGYSLEEVAGKNCRFLQGADTDQPARQTLREAIRLGKETTVVLRNYRKDGTLFWNELSLSPIRDRSGNVTHYVGVQNDVTARVEFEAALRESEKLAALGRLSSSIAHEINNPLGSVMNLIYLANNDADPQATKQYLSMADQELQRVKLITAQSLRFYKQSTRPGSVKADELVGTVLDIYGVRQRQANIAVERRDRPAPPFICMESEIRQVLNNLVANAIESMKGLRGRLLARTRPSTDWASGRKGITITIADTGTGMSAETLANIYKPFFTTKGQFGTGLGLWIASEIVERHYGRLNVRSRQRRSAKDSAGGTVFTLFLPFKTDAQPTDPTQEKKVSRRRGVTTVSV